MSVIRRAGIAIAALSLVARAAAAAPSTTQRCLDDNTQAQNLRRAGALKSAREHLQACGDPACPPVVRDDCTKRLEEVAQAMPTVVFEVKSGAGKDLSAVKVSADDRPLSATLDGTPLEIDPGEHTFTLVVDGEAPVTLKLVLREGDRARRERVVIGAAAPVEAAPVAAVTPPIAQSTSGSTRRVLGLGVGTLGLVGVGLGTAFGFRASSKWSSAQSGCSSPQTCPDHAESTSARDDASSAATISTVAFIAGGAAIAAGAILYFSAPKRGDKPTGLVFAPVVTGSYGGLALQGVL